MVVRSLMALGTVALLAMAGCSSADVIGCTETAACPGGHVCLHGVCALACSNNDECPTGQYCNGSVCAEGVSGAPTITAVTSSDGSTTDPTCNKPTENTTCLGSHLTVAGTNLSGATFKLTSLDDSSVYYNLTASGATATTADLYFGFTTQAEADATLAAGNYTLEAVNAAGAAQAVISLLRGVSSTDITGADIIAKVNAETTGTINADRVAIPKGDDLITQINLGTGVIDATRVDMSSVGAGGTLHIQRTNATVGTAVQVDDSNFYAFCGDEDGCEITIGARYTAYNAGGYINVPAIRFGMPCRFHVDPTTHDWAVANWCSNQWMLGDSSVYQDYQSGQFGIDGNSTEGSLSILKFRVEGTSICTLSENNGPAAIDDTVGLYFWMEDVNVSAFPSANTGRTCELVIKD